MCKLCTLNSYNRFVLYKFLKINNNSSGRYYQKTKKGYKKRLLRGIKIFCKSFLLKLFKTLPKSFLILTRPQICLGYKKLTQYKVTPAPQDSNLSKLQTNLQSISCAGFTRSKFVKAIKKPSIYKVDPA